MTAHIPIGTAFLIEVIRMFMDKATRDGSRNTICFDARTARIHEEEMRNGRQ